MTELAHLQAAEPIPATPAAIPSSAVQLIEWTRSVDAVYAVAEKLVKTSFVPEAFRDKPHEATGAILAGLEVGLSPMAALRSFDVINGTAAPRAITLRAIVQSHGHKMWLAESSKTRAIVRGQRRGESEVQESTWTMDRARDLGLIGKHNWKAQPGAMLVARATAECARLVASDAILGIGYVYEELADQVEETPKAARKRRTAQRAPLPAPEPEIPEELPPGQDDVVRAERTGPQPATDEQLKRIHASLNELGMDSREDKLTYVSRVIDRDIDSSKDLNIREASGLIEALNADLRILRERDAEPELEWPDAAQPPDANGGETQP